jgi:hypothetical protein
VPRTPAPIHVDAELEGKKAWEADTGNTRNFTDADGHGMVPYSGAKLRWNAGTLYLMLYAGDLDLEGRATRHDANLDADDAFQFEFGAGADVRRIAVSVLGTVSDERCLHKRAATCDRGWQSHARVAVDRDGTLNKVGDNDEEWVVEMAIPLSSLGLAHAGTGTRLPFLVRRCEIGVRGRHACGGWGTQARGELVLDP